MAHAGEAAAAEESGEERSALDAHVHGSVPFHAAEPAFSSVPAGHLHQPRCEGQAEYQGDEDHHENAAEKFRGGERPSHQNDEDDAQLDHQVGRGDLEDHGRGKACSFAEDRSGQRHGGIGAGARGDPKECRQGQAARRIVPEKPGHGAVRHEELDDGREAKAQNQGPEDVPEHVERFTKRRLKGTKDIHHETPADNSIPPGGIRLISACHTPRWCASAKRRIPARNGPRSGRFYQRIPTSFSSGCCFTTRPIVTRGCSSTRVSSALSSRWARSAWAKRTRSWTVE